jgi:alanine racemase
MRVTYAEIFPDAIEHNLFRIKSKVTPAKIMAVVKANAYGHGIIEVAKTMEKAGADYLGVGFLEEGINLRQNKIKAPILVLGGVLGYQIKKFIEHNLEITVSSIELAEQINKEVEKLRSNKAKIHLKIDTGMERIGVNWQNALQFVEKVALMKNVEVVGIYSHFATSDEKDKSFALEQLERFNDVLSKVKSLGVEIPLKHIANSGAILDIPESYFDMVRPGIILYGIYPSGETSESIKLKPAMKLKSKVVFLKEVPPNTSVSYGRKYFTKNKSRIVTIPIGYGDGYSRLLSNKADVIINEKKFPVVGTICMDQIMVNIGDNHNIKVGDEVIMIGKSGNEEITALELAEKMGTIPYEIVCGINTRVPRIYNRINNEKRE